MATSAAAAAKPPAEAAPTAALTKNGKTRLIIILVVVLLVLGGAGAWFFMAQHDGEGEHSQASTEPPVFLPLEQFTVNLQSADEQRFLQVSMTLKLAEQAVADAIAAQLPEVRSRVLLLLSTKKPAELTSLEGKNKLALDIAREIEIPITPARTATKGKPKAKDKAKKAKAHAAKERVLAVFFTHFIVQ